MKHSKMSFASNNWAAIVIFLLGFNSICATTAAETGAVEPYISSEAKEKQRIHLNQPEVASTFKRFEESAPTLLKILQAIFEVVLACIWILDSCLNAFLWLLNETVSSCTDVCIRIFGVLFNVVKLLEAFGFGLKFLLELNYAVLSYVFDTLGRIKDSFKHAVTLVKITIANETEHMYESSSLAFEGMQNLFLTAFNHTWVNVQYISSVLTGNFSAPFGLSNLDTSLVASMFVSGFEFLVESIKMTAQMFKDGNLFLFNYLCDAIHMIGKSIFDNGVAIGGFIKDIVISTSNYVIFIVTWPFYCLASTVANISQMLYYSWEAFVSLLCHLDASVRETLSTALWTTMQCISSLPYQITVLIHRYFPGGTVGYMVFASVVVPLILWHEEIKALLISSWVSLRQMNDARPVINILEDQQPFNEDRQPFHEFQQFEVQEAHIVDPSTSEPPLDRPMLFTQNELKCKLEHEKDNQLCVICQDNNKNILLFPCRHVCMCEQCLHEVMRQAGLCPLCRQHIHSTLEVFV